MTIAMDAMLGKDVNITNNGSHVVDRQVRTGRSKDRHLLNMCTGYSFSCKYFYKHKSLQTCI